MVFGSASDVLIAEAGAQFVGAIAGGGGGLVLAGGSGVISNLGGEGQLSGDDSAAFAGFGAYTIGAGGHWSLSGTNALASGQALTVNGVLAVAGALTEATGALVAIGQSGVVNFEASSLLSGSLANSGLLSVKGATLTLVGTVSGPGQVQIDDADLVATSAFSENVAFSGSSGLLSLGISQGYFGTVSGFATDGGDALDLLDVMFKTPGEATFSGTASGGVLTVSDGSHTASIRLQGDYLNATFVAAADGQGGTEVTAQTNQIPASPHVLISAMASFGASAAGRTHLVETWRAPEAHLCSPRSAIA